MDFVYPNWVFNKYTNTSHNWLLSRFLFENGYNIVILIIFMQMFSGIIIDTFK